MLRIQSMQQLFLVVLITQTILGLMVTFYGSVYPIVDIRKAEQMMEFISSTNPKYYSKLTSEEDTSYREEFYDHYTTRGNPKIILCGLFFLAISANIAVPMMYLAVKKKVAEIKEEKERGPEEEEQTGEAPPEDAENTPQDQSF